MKNRLIRMLESLHPGAAAILSPATFQRMAAYQESAEHIVCGALARMQGRRPSETEQTRLQLLAVISTLLHDWVGNHSGDRSRIYQLTCSPAGFEPRDAVESLLREAYLRLLTIAAEPRRVTAHCCELFNWEEASGRQKDATISEAELFRITYHKRFHAVLLFYTVFDKYPSPEETAMAFPMAGLMQLTYDMADIWTDIRSGIYTIPILYRRFGRLERRFQAESARFNQALARLPYPPARKQEYALTVHAVHAMGLLAVRRLRKEAAGVRDVAELALLGRKKLAFGLRNPAMMLALLRKVRELTNLTSYDGPTEPALKRDMRQSARS
ncbi:hypothetical protein [Chitinophaga rhizosphaerae]|uniref:hypothetical protein n=1 Tax=Chitinophaga rhizosphaerae TaxID=1864947 RepID=UPI000F812E51|nr:hypothetical protein [Chitinophaga rhizosphaerae]